MEALEPESAELGTCKACGQELIKFEGDIWHPHHVTRSCPAAPSNMRPGEANFIPTPKTLCDWCREELLPGERRVAWFTKDRHNETTERGVLHLSHLYIHAEEFDGPAGSGQK